jgi:hypothetical protein
MPFSLGVHGDLLGGLADVAAIFPRRRRPGATAITLSLKLYGKPYGKFSESDFSHTFAKNGRQDVKMGCIDASRRQLQSVLKIRVLYTSTRAWLDCAPDFCGKKDALDQNVPQYGPKCQGGGGITAYVVRPHAPDGAPTVGAARIGRGAVLERRAATCGL